MSPDVYLVTAHLGLGDETWSALAPSHDEVLPLLRRIVDLDRARDEEDLLLPPEVDRSDDAAVVRKWFNLEDLPGSAGGVALGRYGEVVVVLPVSGTAIVSATTGRVSR